MWPDRVSNLGPLTYESGALPTARRGPATERRGKGTSHDLVELANDSVWSYVRVAESFSRN